MQHIFYWWRRPQTRVDVSGIPEFRADDGDLVTNPINAAAAGLIPNIQAS